MKAIEQWFPVVLFIVLYSLGGSNFWVCGWNPNKSDHWNKKLLSSSFLWYCLFMLYRVVLTFGPVDEIKRILNFGLFLFQLFVMYVDEFLRCDIIQITWAVLSCDTVYYAVQGGSNFLSLWMKS